MLIEDLPSIDEGQAASTYCCCRRQRGRAFRRQQQEGLTDDVGVPLHRYRYLGFGTDRGAASKRVCHKTVADRPSASSCVCQ